MKFLMDKFLKRLLRKFEVNKYGKKQDNNHCSIDNNNCNIVWNNNGYFYGNSHAYKNFTCNDTGTVFEVPVDLKVRQDMSAAGIRSTGIY